MSHGLDNLTGPATEGIGLRFLNEEWNDSISNDHPFTIQWNESLDGTQAPELGLFKITYPKDGVIAYELVSNLTGSMNNENATCSWTPSHLEDELYTLWLSSSRDARSNWTTSPPWRLKETEAAYLAPDTVSLGIPPTIISEQEEFRRNTGFDYNSSIRSSSHIPNRFLGAQPSKPHKYNF
ncbi:hypothetical protein THARTR1_01080 [Trichoderma harzianum]|uniref:Uncharacterized protein n=1 Tax=Trichoderma harzianum TaxID=5544 RepID=A0A2K0UM59_TRIHA|nr:hypothetical protein THARTR1_01080 [Trichoderma harzianum]